MKHTFDNTLTRVYIEEKPFSNLEKYNYLSVVLVHLPTNPVTPYVTWLVNKSGEPYTCEGHYFMSLDSAIEDFNKRGA